MTAPEQRANADRVRADREFWRGLLAEVGRERMNEPGPMGAWSFKDLTAHLAAWRNCRIPMIQAIARGEPLPPAPWPADIEGDDDAINEWFQQRDRDRTVDDVLDDYDRSFERLATAIEALPEDVARDPNALPWAPGYVVNDVDFTEHLHDEHLPSIRTWLDAKT